MCSDMQHIRWLTSQPCFCQYFVWFNTCRGVKNFGRVTNYKHFSIGNVLQETWIIESKLDNHKGQLGLIMQPCGRIDGDSGENQKTYRSSFHTAKANLRIIGDAVSQRNVVNGALQWPLQMQTAMLWFFLVKNVSGAIVLSRLMNAFAPQKRPRARTVALADAWKWLCTTWMHSLGKRHVTNH